MNVTEELSDWEDSRSMNRKRQWFSIDDALAQLALHKPVQRRYLQQLKNYRNNVTPILNSQNQIPESSTQSLTLQSHSSNRNRSNNSNRAEQRIKQETATAI